ncbi:hypothetical protein K450DRAFT_275605 [Umbelopsis ramanniana AG]|uniref:Uncharacterized protein n=1 Tax=Umbelopsis ramanniana AG TaxID=1314678 RepID=A0AAD5E2F9_UMBRA|nr:uncharacterized protein K450DRAFT_275605 [Umbelopsis ramanniana AG]KAI8575472.1 hypothetical protein K450DRAFT_275605 [Umbelopsis ramanniana AG]
MSLFSKLSGKGSQSSTEKAIYPWSQRKLTGASCLPRIAHAATQHNDRVVCLFGGVTKGAPKKDLYLIDPVNLSASATSTGGDAPSARCYHSIVSIGNQLIVFGGQLKSPADHGDNTVYSLNIQTRQWTRTLSDSSDPVPRQAHAAAVSANQMYIHGGHTVNGQMLGDLLIFHAGNTLPTKMKAHHHDLDIHVSSWTISSICKFGGSDGHTLLNDIWCFDLSSHLWTNINAMGYVPSPREGASIAYADGAIYLFGGRSTDGQALGDLCAYRIYNQRWYMFQNMGPAPSPRYGHSLTAIQEKIFVIGGLLPPKAEDPNLVHVLDTSRIKYPSDAGINGSPQGVRTPENLGPQIRRSYQELAERGPPSPRSAQANNGPMLNPSPPHGQPPSPKYPPAPMPLPNGHSSSQMQRVSHFPDDDGQLRRMTSNRATLKEPVRTEASRPARSASLRHGNKAGNLSHSASSGSIRSAADQRAVRPMEQQQHSYGQGDYDYMDKDDTTGHPPQSPPTPLPTGQNTPSPVPAQRRGPLSTKTSTSQLSMEHNRTDSGSPSLHNDATLQAAQEERQALLREIKNRDAVIADMKSKEQWWRTEVSLARKMRVGSPTHEDRFGFSEEDLSNGVFDVGNMNEEQANVFDELVKCKMEIKRVRALIGHQGHQAVNTVVEADKMRLAALQEAAYFKSKYMALKSGQKDEVDKVEAERMQQLEQRLASALSNSESKQRDLDRVQRQAGHDQAARRLAQERAQQAQQDAKMAQQAQARALEENTELHARANTAEAQARDYATRMADLSNRLAEALSSTKATGSLSDAKLQITKLEAANIKARGEVASLQQQLAASMDEIATLSNTVSKQEAELTEYVRKLEDAEVKVAMMKHAMINKGFKIHEQDFDQDSSTGQMAKLQAEIASARRLCDNLVESERLANEKAQAAINEAENYRKRLAERGDVQDTVNKNQESLANVSVIEEQLRARIRQLEDDLEDGRYEHEVEDWKSKAAHAKEELELVMQTVHHLKQNNSDLENDLKSALNQQLSSTKLSDEKQTWLREKAVLESQLYDLREKLAGLENTALDSMSRAEELTNDVKQLEDDREILMADRQKYKSRYNEHKKEARRHIQDLTEEIERLSEALENTNSALEHTNTELDETRLMNQKLKKDLETVKPQGGASSVHDWEDQRAQYEDEIAQRERQVHNLTLERQALQQQYKDAQHKIELLLEQLDEPSHHQDTSNNDDGYPRDTKHNSFLEHVAAA